MGTFKTHLENKSFIFARSFIVPERQRFFFSLFIYSNDGLNLNCFQTYTPRGIRNFMADWQSVNSYMHVVYAPFYAIGR